MLGAACWALATVSSEASPLEPRAPLPVQVEEARAAEGYAVERRFTGRVRARRQVRPSFERGGRLERVAVEEGARVEVGQVLAELDREPLLRQRRELRAARDAARARRDEALEGPRPEQIAAARSRLEELEVQWDLALLRTRRRAELVEAGVMSVEELDAFSTDDRALAARRAAAESALEELESGTRIEQITARRAELEQWEGRLAQLELDLERSTLRAPFAGTVLRRLLDEGTVVSAGSSVLELVEDGVLEAWIGVPEERTAALRPGQQATMSGALGPLEGKVRSVLPEVDPTTRTRTVVLDLHAGSPATPGETVELILEQWIDSAGLWVPLRSLSRGERGVFLCSTVEGEQDDARVRLHEVEVLHRDGLAALVRGGSLSDGRRVLVGGTLRVAPGQRVRVVANP